MFSAAPLPNNQWVHVAVTIDWLKSPLGGQFYLDGQPTSPFSTVVHETAPNSTPDPLLVGINLLHFLPDNNFAWKGCLDEIEIFHRALLPEEIKAIRDAGSGGKCKCFCVLPPVTPFFSGDQAKTVTARCFNLNSTWTDLNYWFEGWLPWGDITGAATFTPPSGGWYFDPNNNSIIVPSFSIYDIPVTIARPANMTAAGQVGYYQMIAGPGWPGWTLPLYRCQAQVVNSPGLQIAIADQAVAITNTTLTNATFRYWLDVTDNHNAKDWSCIILNRQPPGVPVTGMVSNLPPGASTNIQLTCESVLPDPLGTYWIQVFAVSGDGRMYSLGSIPHQNYLLPPAPLSLSITLSNSLICSPFLAEEVKRLGDQKTMSGRFVLVAATARRPRTRCLSSDEVLRLPDDVAFLLKRLHYPSHFESVSGLARQQTEERIAGSPMTSFAKSRMAAVPPRSTLCPTSIASRISLAPTPSSFARPTW